MQHQKLSEKENSSAAWRPTWADADARKIPCVPTLFLINNGLFENRIVLILAKIQERQKLKQNVLWLQKPFEK